MSLWVTCRLCKAGPTATERQVRLAWRAMMSRRSIPTNEMRARSSQALATAQPGHATNQAFVPGQENKREQRNMAQGTEAAAPLGNALLCFAFIRLLARRARAGVAVLRPVRHRSRPPRTWRCGAQSCVFAVGVGNGQYHLSPTDPGMTPTVPSPLAIHGSEIRKAVEEKRRERARASRVRYVLLWKDYSITETRTDQAVACPASNDS